MKLSIIAIVICAALGCGAWAGGCASAKPTPTPVPSTATCKEACTTLDSLGCPEGSEPSCEDACLKIQSGGITVLDLDCLAKATSPAVAEACGGITCDVSLGKKSASCQLACDKVTHFKCPEASGCLATCLKVTAAHLADWNLGCLASAGTITQLRSCGSVACK